MVVHLLLLFDASPSASSFFSKVFILSPQAAHNAAQDHLREDRLIMNSVPQDTEVKNKDTLTFYSLSYEEEIRYAESFSTVC